jgi:cytochrome c553
MRLLRCVARCCTVLFVAHSLSAQDGGALFKKSCASCHDANIERVPNRETLHTMSPEHVLEVMETGAMISMASHLSPTERRAIAEFVTEKPLGHALQRSPLPRAMCAGAPGVFTESPRDRNGMPGARTSPTRVIRTPLWDLRQNCRV